MKKRIELEEKLRMFRLRGKDKKMRKST